MNVVSLFSGGGGLDLGFISSGYKVVWAIDNNKNAVSTYEANIGNHIIYGDIVEFDEKVIPKADLIIGGPPCQSFSLSGNRDSEDSRGQLVWRYLQILEHLNPKAFVFENVTGLLSAKDSKGNKVIELLHHAFETIGYTISTQVMNAADYGVPQKRKRVIIVGLKGEEKFKFPEPTHNESGEGLLKHVSVYDALDDLGTAVADSSMVAVYKSKPLNEYQKRIRGDNSLITEHIIPTMSDLDKYIVKHVTPGGNYMDIPREVNSKRIRRLQETGGHTTCYGRMHPSKPSYTINTYFNRPNVGCNIHYADDRLITMREALRLQSFPDSYKLVSTSKQGKHLVIGNAVPPQLAKVIADRLKNYL